MARENREEEPWVVFEEGKQNPKKLVNLKHPREVFIEAGAWFALRVPFFYRLRHLDLSHLPDENGRQQPWR